MDIVETKIPDLYIIKPKVFTDERGYFFESYNKEVFLKLGIDHNFVQDNESFSNKTDSIIFLWMFPVETS